MAKTPISQCWGLGSIPGQGTRFHMPQFSSHTTAERPPMLQLRPDAEKINNKQTLKKKKILVLDFIDSQWGVTEYTLRGVGPDLGTAGPLGPRSLCVGN